MKIGYARVSTIEQNEARQLEALQAAGCEKIYLDKCSGKNTNREQLKSMMTFAREGDIVITESISRIARNTRDLLRIIDDLTEKGISFISQKENIDTTTPQGRFVLTIFAALAELERESIRERQREGIEIAKREGKYRGRKPIQIDEKAFREICQEWRSGRITARQAMRLLDLKPNTFYKNVKLLNV